LLHSKLSDAAPFGLPGRVELLDDTAPAVSACQRYTTEASSWVLVILPTGHSQVRLCSATPRAQHRPAWQVAHPEGAMRYDEGDRESENIEDRRGQFGRRLRFPRGGRRVQIPIPMGRRSGGLSLTTLLILGALMLI